VSVLNRIALALPFFRIDRFTMDTLTRLANSVSVIPFAANT
jgi:hypothetical protein